MELAADKQVEKPVSFDLLTYQAPFLIEKLLKDAIIESTEEGEMLFTEVKRWMLLTRVDRSKIWEMHSFRIDEVWHQFILFTDEYAKFCDYYFGSYFSHAPGNAPGIEDTDSSLVGSFSEFEQSYRKNFNIDLPGVWFDEKSVDLQRRVLNYYAGKLLLKESDGAISIINDEGKVTMSINSVARDAMTFIAATKAFYVRELPGDLTDDEKKFLVKTLIEFNILRVAS